MDNSFSNLISSSQRILILLPAKPYFDQVAAGLSLYLSLKKTKDVDISSPMPMIVEFNRLVGVDKITAEVGNKNLLIKFVEYDAKNVERVSADINKATNEFYLTVVPKPSITPPKKEQIVFSYSGVSADTAILIGGANESHFPALSSKSFAGIKIIHVGVRELTMSGGNPLSFARPASSVSEITSQLINEAGLEIDADIATNLLAGIESATKNFSAPSVNADTFETVASLLRKGGRRMQERVESQSPQKIVTSLGTGEEKTPDEWLEPKIYKGTTVS